MFQTTNQIHHSPIIGKYGSIIRKYGINIGKYGPGPNLIKWKTTQLTWHQLENMHHSCVSSSF